ncbi:Transposon Tn10 TetD protein [Pseudovibrio axinellae]|uniref:Transposon Tn10 TetD protein n=1 Tax=Pseudovibrio axinellae TaxID=989403 RepID=A0A165XY93_9HYPH|nr:AraC family transcriptional regulator [Pseudovibrio axinellae]KZL18239.1 Transposon Tn10 TetD protein [Pseudovibrio axinellae]SER71771.1 transcriptional regulator, AraC family [Pseudovibrio axinellae]
MPGLERSCTHDWVQTAPWQAGIQRIEAFFSGEAYAPHRHDTYSIGYTIKGVQSFDYRGVRADSTSGQVIVLHPDELHDGEAGTDEGFHYRMLYIEPAMVREALGQSANALPFVKEAVFSDQRLYWAILAAFSDMHLTLDPVALDEIITLLADGLLTKDSSANKAVGSFIDVRATRLARDYLDANIDQKVVSEELETVTGQDRYSLARQFRKAYGTSPYRYLMMRRLDKVRAQITTGMSLANAALNAGFSDQAHMTRRFKANYGISPGHWQRLARRMKTPSDMDNITQFPRKS